MKLVIYSGNYMKATRVSPIVFCPMSHNKGLPRMHFVIKPSYYLVLSPLTGPRQPSVVLPHERFAGNGWGKKKFCGQATPTMSHCLYAPSTTTSLHIHSHSHSSSQLPPLSLELQPLQFTLTHLNNNNNNNHSNHHHYHFDQDSHYHTN